ncbi:hypothetical protein JOD07_001427 [Defluviitalea raffinosedens]|jgi:hypothetical protein|nr:hypothetical protein [Defluviitalea raffinosedens]
MMNNHIRDFLTRHFLMGSESVFYIKAKVIWKNIEIIFGIY